MKDLYKKYLYIPDEKEGKVSEKVLLTRIALGVLFILLCLSNLAFVALAHFDSTASSGKTPLVSACYDLD